MCCDHFTFTIDLSVVDVNVNTTVHFIQNTGISNLNTLSGLLLQNTCRFCLLCGILLSWGMYSWTDIHTYIDTH